MRIKLPFLAETVVIPGLPHISNFTCGGVTGHASDCMRSECYTIKHDHCTPETTHLAVMEV